MKKYKKIKELERQLNVSDKLLEAVCSSLERANHQIKVLQEAITKIEEPFLHAVRKTDYNSDKVWWNKRLDEMESKLSHKWYLNVGIYERIRQEIADQISKNMNDIIKIKEIIQKDE